MQFEKLKLNYEFRRLYSKGKAFVTPNFVLYALKGRSGRIRLGITVGKKFGCAVKRNRAKRVITAAFRECCPHICSGYDFVVVARTQILCVKSTQVAEIMRQQLSDAGLWCDEQKADI